MPSLGFDPDWRPSVPTTIVFVHGAIVNGMEMGLMRRRLRRYGYRVRQFHYHSVLCGVEENARLLKTFLDQTPGEHLHVVGHSMGGILTRHVFQNDPDPRQGRLIALGSPFLDCWIAHRVSGLHSRGYCLLGRTAHEHILQPRDPVWRGQREFGVIAGTYPLGIGCVFSNLPVPSDGVVLWEETRLQGARDHVTYRLNHFGLLLSRRCAMQAARFLATGTFAHPAPEPLPAEPEMVGLAGS